MRWEALNVLLLALCSCCAAGITTGSTAAVESKVEVMTDEDFDVKTTGSGDWLINIYAPWCKHCQQLEPIWRSVAERLNGRIRVAKVDGESSRMLVKRFSVEAYPSIFLIKAGKVYVYDDGQRSEQQFEEWALGGYRATEPLPPHRSPVGWIGRTLGFAMGLPGRFHRFYVWANREKGVNELTLLLSMLAIPITLGVIGICALDLYYTRAHFLAPEEHRHPD